MRFIAVIVFAISFSFVALSEVRATNKTLRFSEYLEKILNHHPKWQSQKLQIVSEKSALRSKFLSASPSINLIASEPIKKWGSQFEHNSELKLNLNLFKAGGDFFNYRSALAQSDQKDLELDLSAIKFQAAAARVLFDYLELKFQLQSRALLIESKRELLRAAQLRFAKGQLPEQEVEKVKIEVSNSEIELKQSEVDQMELEADLRSYLLGDSIELVWPWLSVMPIDSKNKVKKVMDRKAYKYLDADVNIKRAEQSITTTTLLPRMDLITAYESNRLFPDSNGEWSSYLSFSWSLWDRGETFARRRALSEQGFAAEEELRNFRIVESEKQNTFERRLNILHENVRQSVSAVNNSRKIAKDSLRRFQLGRASVNDLSIDQSRLFSAEILAQRAIKRLHLFLLESCVDADERPSACYK